MAVDSFRAFATLELTPELQLLSDIPVTSTCEVTLPVSAQLQLAANITTSATCAVTPPPNAQLQLVSSVPIGSTCEIDAVDMQLASNISVSGTLELTPEAPAELQLASDVTMVNTGEVTAEPPAQLQMTGNISMAGTAIVSPEAAHPVLSATVSQVNTARVASQPKLQTTVSMSANAKLTGQIALRAPISMSHQAALSGTGAQVVNVPTSGAGAPDETGATDATDDLNVFLNAVPNNRLVRFPLNALYKIEGQITITNKTNVTWDFNGATFFAETNGTPPAGSTPNQIESYFRNRGQWELNQCTGCRITSSAVAKGKIRGNNTLYSTLYVPTSAGITTVGATSGLTQPFTVNLSSRAGVPVGGAAAKIDGRTITFVAAPNNTLTLTGCRVVAGSTAGTLAAGSAVSIGNPGGGSIEGAFNVAYESQNTLRLVACVDMEIDNLDMRDPWGDLIGHRVGVGATGSLEDCIDCTTHDCVLLNCGRQCITLDAGTNIVVEDSIVDGAGHAIVDLEVTGGGPIDGFYLRRCTIGDAKLHFIAAGQEGYVDIRNIFVEDNTFIGGHIDVAATAVGACKTKTTAGQALDATYVNGRFDAVGQAAAGDPVTPTPAQLGQPGNNGFGAYLKANTNQKIPIAKTDGVQMNIIVQPGNPATPGPDAYEQLLVNDQQSGAGLTPQGQPRAVENGVYVLTDEGKNDPGGRPWILRRTQTSSFAYQLWPGDKTKTFYISLTEGNHGDEDWQQANSSGTKIIGRDAINFTKKATRAPGDPIQGRRGPWTLTDNRVGDSGLTSVHGSSSGALKFNYIDGITVKRNDFSLAANRRQHIVDEYACCGVDVPLTGPNANDVYMALQNGSLNPNPIEGTDFVTLTSYRLNHPDC